MGVKGRDFVRAIEKLMALRKCSLSIEGWVARFGNGFARDGCTIRYARSICIWKELGWNGTDHDLLLRNKLLLTNNTDICFPHISFYT